MADPLMHPRSATEPRTGIAGSPTVARNGMSRRRFIGYLIAAPTVVGAAQLFGGPAKAAIPTVQPVDVYDLSDLLTEATLLTAGMIKVVGQRRRHRLVRAAAGRGRAGDHHRHRDDDRRRDGPAAREGQRDACRRAAGAAVQPVHRRLELHALDLHAGSRRRRHRPPPADPRRGRRCGESTRSTSRSAMA